MKQIILHSLTLTNFRGEKQRTTTFNPNSPTYICGDNGLGKTRHFDAFCWLLFGKDSHDRKDFELRTYDANHEPLHHCECSVAAEISVDGEIINLKRKYKEDWVKPRGQAEEVLKGNVTECTWNDVPVKVSEYSKRIRENIIDETVFKMITNPRYFCEKMKWQLQREQLLQMAGTKTDAEIAADNKDFQTLLDRLNGKSLSDFRKEIAAAKKPLQAEKDGIEPRIDQVQKMRPENEDWDALAKEETSLTTQIADIDSQLQSDDKRDEETLKRISQFRRQVDDLEAKKDDIIKREQKKVDDEADKSNNERDQLQKQRSALYEKHNEIQGDIDSNKQRQAYLNEQISGIDKQLADLRNEWFSISKSVYTGSEICPVCGQRLPQDMIDKAKLAFEDDKKKKLIDNNNNGKKLSAQKKPFVDELAKKVGDLKTLESNLKANDKATVDIFDQINKHKLVQKTPVNPQDFDDWKETDKEQKDVEKKIKLLQTSLEKSGDKEEREKQVAKLKADKETLQQKLEDVKAHLANKKRIEDDLAEIESLTNRGKELAEQIAQLEKKEFIADQFSKKKVKDCEQRVNGLFHYVRFQLFDTTQESNEFECCTPLLNGIPYGVVNTASKLNMGLDIINTLCRFNNVTAPIFIDSAESINHPIPTQSQLIFLRVTSDKQLIIK